MGNSLRCCLACVLPCGALDLIRIVHLNGFIEEHTGRLTAADVLKNHPNHVLSKPCTSQGMPRRILLLSPQSELKRGSIYFLIPASSLPPSHKINDKIVAKLGKKSPPEIVNVVGSVREKKSKSRQRVRSKSNTGLWEPRLESILED